MHFRNSSPNALQKLVAECALSRGFSIAIVFFSGVCAARVKLPMLCIMLCDLLFFFASVAVCFFFLLCHGTVRCDRQGRFVCGGINLENIDQPADVWKPRARVFRVEDGKGVRRILPDEVCLRTCAFSLVQGAGLAVGGRSSILSASACCSNDLQSDAGGGESLTIFLCFRSYEGPLPTFRLPWLVPCDPWWAAKDRACPATPSYLASESCHKGCVV